LLFSWTYSLAQPVTTTTTDPPIDPQAEFVDIETPQILDNGWVIVPAQVQMLTQGQERARTKVLEQARSEAVALIAGIEVKSASQDLQVSIQHNGQFVYGFDAFSALSDQQSYGRIDQQEVIGDTVIVLAGTPYYKIRLRCHVALEKSQRDPSFSLRAQLNQENFRHGDEMILNLKTTKDCHVTVFNLLTNGTVEVLYPQTGILEENLVANTVFEIPSLSLRQQGIRLRKYADDKVPQAEALYVVEARYTRRKVDRLRAINLKLERLRILLRITHDLQLLPHKSYEFATRSLDEIGRMIGAWLKQQESS
jgi:hypothetical protein